LKAGFAPISAAGARGNIEAATKHWFNVGWFAPARKNEEVAAELAAILADYSGSRCFDLGCHRCTS
jgi:hypothetical protein